MIVIEGIFFPRCTDNMFWADKEKVSCLIELYCAYECLWNVKSSEYKNVSSKKNAKVDIGTHLVLYIVSDGDESDLQPASNIEQDNDVVDVDSDDTVLYMYIVSDGESSSSASVSHQLQFTCFLLSRLSIFDCRPTRLSSQ